MGASSDVHPPSGSGPGCFVAHSSPLWDVAVEVVTRELTRAGRDGNPFAEAVRFVDAMRSSGRLAGYEQDGEQCRSQWSVLACHAWWYAHEPTESREAALQAFKTGTVSWAAGASPTSACSQGQTTSCCPALVRTDPLYGSDVHALYALSEARRAARAPAQSTIPIWLLAIAAVGSFGLTLLSFVAGRSSRTP